MIILDTNVVSEVMRPEPNLNVRMWLNSQEISTLFLTSVTVAELTFGIDSLPHGKRQTGLRKVLDEMLGFFVDRILPFDNLAAQHYARLAVMARRAGLGFPTPDGYIAAIAGSTKYVVATRDVSAFKAAQVQTIDPWTLNLP